MFRDRPEIREPAVQVRMLLPRREFDELRELARRGGGGHSPQTVIKEMIRDGLQRQAEARLAR